MGRQLRKTGYVSLLLADPVFPLHWKSRGASAKRPGGVGDTASPEGGKPGIEKTARLVWVHINLVVCVYESL